MDLSHNNKFALRYNFLLYFPLVFPIKTLVTMSQPYLDWIKVKGFSRHQEGRWEENSAPTMAHTRSSSHPEWSSGAGIDGDHRTNKNSPTTLGSFCHLGSKANRPKAENQGCFIKNERKEPKAEGTKTSLGLLKKRISIKDRSASRKKEFLWLWNFSPQAKQVSFRKNTWE